MTEEEIIFLSIGESITDASQSKLFGKPCFKVGGKAFMCFFQDEMVFKLTGESHLDAISLHGAKLFDPSGKNRPMKEWVQVPSDHSENWKEYATSAMEYVSGK